MQVNQTIFPDGNGNQATQTFFLLNFDVTDGGSSNLTNVSFYIQVLSPKIASSSSEKHNSAEAFPLFLTQWNHLSWAHAGLSRGYVSVVYPGGDTRDAAPLFQAAYPNASMMLILARAFVLSRTLDFLLSHRETDFPILNGQVCVTGHSRNGKQSLIAAAFDTRITAVVGSSPGAPIAAPYHFSSANFYGEGPNAGEAGHWWLPSIVDFTAHPEKLPMDGHGVLALIAPRAVMLSHGWTDAEGDLTFANEMSVRAASEVFSLLNASSALGLANRAGDHHGFLDLQSYFDWFDLSLHRLPAPVFPLAGTNYPMAPFTRVYQTAAGFEYRTWETLFGQPPFTPPPPARSQPLANRIQWLLQGPGAGVRGTGSSYAEDGAGRFGYIAVMMGRDLEQHSTGDLTFNPNFPHNPE